MTRATDYRVVFVEWAMPRVPAREWQWAHERERPPVICQSVGWLLRETDEYLVLVQDLGDVQGDDLLACYHEREIDLRDILRIVELGPLPTQKEPTSEEFNAHIKRAVEKLQEIMARGTSDGRPTIALLAADKPDPVPAQKEPTPAVSC
jgi:hypothetical protein